MTFLRHLITATGIAMMIPSVNAANPTIGNIIARLDTISSYNGQAAFTVSMPQLSEDIVYDVGLTQLSTPSDRLGCQSYIIDWTMKNTPGNATSGFSAYFNGNHYRYSGERIQEYHMEWDSIPFRPEVIGSRSEGVHRSVQFFNMLPQAISSELTRMKSDSAYHVEFHPDTLISGRHMTAVDALLLQDGVTAMEAEYLFDPATLLPVRIHLENNPGSISEQTVIIDYLANSKAELQTIDEPTLIDRYPDEFALFRESNFSIENLPGRQLPGFALPTTTGERYSRRSSDNFRQPTIVALLDASVSFSADVVRQLREAIDRMPVNADLIMAFVDNNVDRIESIVTGIRPGEHLLMSARPLVRDCGAASLPTVLITGADGKVKNVIIGYNKDLTSDVIQKMAIIK